MLVPKREVFHKIAGIIFYSRWNNWLPVIAAYNFNKFRINKKVNYSIESTFFEISSECPKRTLQKKDISLYKRHARHSIRLDSPLLKFVQAQNRINQFINTSLDADLLICWNLIILRDFKKKRIEIIYSNKFGGYNEELATFLPQNYIGANLKFVFSTFLGNFSCVLFHSSGIIINGKAIIFLAPDEGGKTTAITLYKNPCILSEDQIVCELKNQQVIAHSTPFGGSTTGPIKARCVGFFLLEKANKFKISPICKNDLVQYIWNEHKNTFLFLPKQQKVILFNLIYDICHIVPAFNLKFQKNYIDWSAIKAIVRKS